MWSRVNAKSISKYRDWVDTAHERRVLHEADDHKDVTDFRRVAHNGEQEHFNDFCQDFPRALASFQFDQFFRAFVRFAGQPLYFMNHSCFPYHQVHTDIFNVPFADHKDAIHKVRVDEKQDLGQSA